MGARTTGELRLKGPIFNTWSFNPTCRVNGNFIDKVEGSAETTLMRVHWEQLVDVCSGF